MLISWFYYEIYEDISEAIKREKQLKVVQGEEN